ncbi:cytochrome c oxidase accessory protein CcoG [Niveispirillum cyanobacteriorum]|uniref:Cytochrome c oxidase accessory protein CcoG n=2 Tax=Azospirillaceae TaxID=2829815 RepID=A0A2K9NIZ3_9PROT|nr:cytochrome c oxidase accessory protein CcoG [Niveispirillum cyanobacteriorum]AIW60948.1 nitrogen fixation protein FixG [Azospirillum sp. TH16]AUN33011.1 cytochrome c oxidase accessory protein CcoG [Niveispirillum cyanobacteriorum]GGE46233.1 ferredoxin [Niveispirillum cyanobacteriorum]
MAGPETLLEKAAAADAAQAAFEKGPVRKPAPKAAGVPPPSLYAARVKVQPKSVTGKYRTIKWAVLIFCLTLYYLAPWVRWDRGPDAPSQALLIDMGAPRAYLFGIEIWPQEVYFITGLLVLGSLGLFLVTALFGRLWCGYACPQTVWTDLFMLVERWIEGDRGARMRLDKAPMSVEKFTKRTAKHAAWLLIALATGGAWALYFNDAPTFVVEFFTGHATLVQYFFVGLFTTTTYVLAGWAREQVCTYMCPWPRFQAAMLDDQSMVVTYERWRGEARGPHKAGTSWDGRGDCIDCGQCVAVCPTGIDIRDGLQLECIGCGLCIDSCNQIMDKVGRPRELITFDTEARQQARAKGGRAKWKIVRPRTLIYAGLLVLVSTVMLAALLLRTTVEVNVLRDRAPLFVTLSDGGVRNGYTLKVLNKRREAVDFLLSLKGMKDGHLLVQDVGEAGDGQSVILPVKPDKVATFRVFVTAPPDRERDERVEIEFVLTNPVRREGDAYDAVFVGPHLRHHHDRD